MAERFNLLSRLMIGFDGTEIPDYLPELAARGLRSVVIYGNNLAPGADLAEWVQNVRSVLGPDAIIAIDEEGGDVTRVDYLTGSRFAGNAALGKIAELETTERDGRLLGSMLAEMGINLNFGPVADVNLNPANPVIGNRSFGADADLVANHVAAFVRGQQSAGVGATLKHFPGHGDVAVDSHKSLPVVAGGWPELERNHLAPFRSGIASGAACVMVGHLYLGDGIAASLSPDVIARLREDLGFDGLVVTDALDMGAITNDSSIAHATVSALLAGNDLACLGPNTKLSDIDQIESLWSEVSGEEREQNMQLATERMAAFVDGFVPAVIDSAQPTYDLNYVIPERFVGCARYRISSGANPAVGFVPWFADVDAAESSLERISADVGEAEAVILVRGPLQPDHLAKSLSTEQLNRVFVISSDPVRKDYPAQHLVTYGFALPQSRALQFALSRKDG